MSTNRRLFYAVEQIGFAKDGFTTYTAAHGVQSVGITTSFNLEQVFEIGQLSIYQNIESIPDVEVTVEKVLDGYPLLYHLATNGSTTGSLVGRSNAKTTVALSTFADTLSSASGAALAECHMSGMVISALSYTFPTEGHASESVTLIGNSKLWHDVELGDAALFSGVFLSNDDVPAALTGSGGVQNRWDVIFTPLTGSPTGVDANGQTKAFMTVLPTDIYGITASGTNPIAPDGTFTVPVQSISVSADLGRNPIYQLGKKAYYTRYVSFPLEIRTEIEVNATKFDNVSGDETGGHNGAAIGSNLKAQSIRVQMREGTRIDLGVNNKLNTVAWSGGDATSGGSNVTNRYSYVTYNDLWVGHPKDPSGPYLA